MGGRPRRCPIRPAEGPGAAELHRSTRASCWTNDEGLRRRSTWNRGGRRRADHRGRDVTQRANDKRTGADGRQVRRIWAGCRTTCRPIRASSAPRRSPSPLGRHEPADSARPAKHGGDSSAEGAGPPRIRRPRRHPSPTRCATSSATGWTSTLQAAQGDRRAGIQPDQGGAWLPPILAPRSAERPLQFDLIALTTTCSTVPQRLVAIDRRSGITSLVGRESPASGAGSGPVRPLRVFLGPTTARRRP